MAEASLKGATEGGAGERLSSERRLTSVQILLAVALAIGLILVLNFSSRIQLDRDLGRIHGRFTAEIESLLDEQHALITELEYVKGDAYVEYWARDAGKMIRDGEVLILPRSLGSAEVKLKPAVRLVKFETSAPAPENWELWWALFFDAPPPRL